MRRSPNTLDPSLAIFLPEEEVARRVSARRARQVAECRRARRLRRVRALSVLTALWFVFIAMGIVAFGVLASGATLVGVWMQCADSLPHTPGRSFLRDDLSDPCRLDPARRGPDDTHPGGRQLP